MSFILNNCGYTPIYSVKENNFYIKKIFQKETSKLNNKISNNIKLFSNQNSTNIFQIEINSNKEIEIIQKDNKGEPSKFKMTIFVTINIFNKNDYELNKTKVFTSNLLASFIINNKVKLNDNINDYLNIPFKNNVKKPITRTCVARPGSRRITYTVFI